MTPKTGIPASAADGDPFVGAAPVAPGLTWGAGACRVEVMKAARSARKAIWESILKMALILREFHDLRW